MSFLDKIRKAVESVREDREKVVETPKVTIEIKGIGEFYSFLDRKIKENSNYLQETKKKIKKRIEEFTKEIQMTIAILEKVDLSKRKEQEKVKFIVLENLNLYISHLNRLVQHLENLENREDSDTEKYLLQIFSSLNDFKKSSYISYEKSTFLIGKEMDASRKVVISFSQDMENLGKEKKPLFDEQKLLANLANLRSEISKNESNLKEISARINDLDIEMKTTKENIEKTKAEILEIQNSADYKKDLEEKDRENEKIKDLEEKIRLLKSEINFKLLSRVFHYDVKKNSILKNYSSDFKKALKEDSFLEIRKLVKEVQKKDLEEMEDIRNSLIKSEAGMITKTEGRISRLNQNLNSFHIHILEIEKNISQELNKKERVEGKNKRALSEMEDISKPITRVSLIS